MTQLRAVLWDVDGTIAESERDGHRVAFNFAFESMGLEWRWDEARYGELLQVTGGRKRLMNDMTSRSDAPALSGEREALAVELHARKNTFYSQLVRGAGLPLRPGVEKLMRECGVAGVRMGIVTTTGRRNVDALLQVHLGARWRDLFGAVVCGEDVHHRKPDPESYVLALNTLGIGPLEAVALEDSPGGVAAARAADIPVVVPLSAYFTHTTIEGAIAIGHSLDDRSSWRPALPPVVGMKPPAASDTDTDTAAPTPVSLDDIRTWCAQMESVSHFG